MKTPRDYLADFYLEFLNNWLTREAYAAHNEMHVNHCIYLLDLGRQYHEERAECNR